MRKKFKANGRLEPKKNVSSIKDNKKVLRCPFCDFENELKESLTFGECYICTNCGKEITGSI